VVLCTITILLLFFLPKPKSFFDPHINKTLTILESNFDIIQKELNVVEPFTIYDETATELTDNLVDNMTNDLVNKLNEIPQTYEFLRTIKGIKKVYIEDLPAKLKTERQKGDPLVDNTTLTCILPINISCGKKNSIWVDGEIKFFTEGELILYDASREKIMENKHFDKSTRVLFIIIDRPIDIPTGIC
jgi:hypothetical protein